MATRIVMGLCAAAFVMASDAALAGKPEVLVQFEIAVPAFQRNLPQRAQAEQAIAAAIAAELERQYVFAHWLAQAPAQPQMQLGRLVLRMDQNPAMQPNPQVFVHWFGARADPGAQLADRLDDRAAGGRPRDRDSAALERGALFLGNRARRALRQTGRSDETGRHHDARPDCGPCRAGPGANRISGPVARLDYQGELRCQADQPRSPELERPAAADPERCEDVLLHLRLQAPRRA